LNRWTVLVATNNQPQNPEAAPAPERDPHQRGLGAVDVAEQLRLFSTALQSAANAIVITNFEGAIQWVNSAFTKLTGYSADEVMGQNPRILKSGQHPPEFYAALWKTARAGKVWRGELINKRKDGALYTEEMTITPLAGKDGGWTHFIAIKQDVTARKEADAALRESRAKLQAALASMTDAVFVSDTEGRLVESNDAFAAFHRFRSQQECPQTMAEYAEVLEIFEQDGNSVSQAQRPVMRALRGETVTNAEYKLRRKDTGEAWMGSYSFGPIRGADGRIVGSVVVGRDITERKRTEEAQAQLAAIVEWSDDAIFSQSLDSHILTWNAGAEKMFGYRASEVIGQPTKLLYPPERFEEEARVLEQFTRGQAVQHYETVRLTKDGRRLDVALTISPVKDRQGRVIGASKIVRDISEIVQARRILTRSHEELERLVAERTAKLQELLGELEHFSYSIIHDMRAPLRAMQGFADLLESTCQQPEDKELLEHIKTASRRMDLLITDALNYNRAVRQELALSPVNAEALLRAMLDSYPEFQPSVAQIEIAGPLPAVLANEAGLTQCFSNLLRNAVKFVPPGERPRIRIWAEAGAGGVRLCVADQGIGIPASMIPRVFDMFSRGHHSYPGTGIGLALVRKVMDRMGGKVTVESEPGHGSRFWLHLKTVETTPTAKS
jgi:PAS domain S-box-containing protein